MDKTMRRVVMLCVLFIALALAASVFVVSGKSCSTLLEDPLGSVRNTALNGAVDASGLKAKADAELRSHSAAIAAKTGMPQAAVDQAIDALDIPSWQVTDLPATATATGSHHIQQGGVDAVVTTYDAGNLIGVKAYGQDLTFEVPPSAESYLNLLNLMG